MTKLFFTLPMTFMVAAGCSVHPDDILVTRVTHATLSGGNTRTPVISVGLRATLKPDHPILDADAFFCNDPKRRRLRSWGTFLVAPKRPTAAEPAEFVLLIGVTNDPRVKNELIHSDYDLRTSRDDVCINEATYVYLPVMSSNTATIENVVVKEALRNKPVPVSGIYSQYGRNSLLSDNMILGIKE